MFPIDKVKLHTHLSHHGGPMSFLFLLISSAWCALPKWRPPAYTLFKALCEAAWLVETRFPH